MITSLDNYMFWTDVRIRPGELYDILVKTAKGTQTGSFLYSDLILDCEHSEPHYIFVEKVDRYQILISLEELCNTIRFRS